MAIRLSDLPAILPPGLHAMGVERLRYLAVNRFPLSKRRRLIMDGFMKIACKLVEHRVIGDLILDGSFLTQEIEPNDLDFTLCVSEWFYYCSKGDQRAYLDWIGDDKTIKETHLCDCYLCVECPPSGEAYFDGIQTREYWVNLYTYSKVVKRERGVAIIELNGLLL